jgi:hypothetical protein
MSHFAVLVATKERGISAVEEALQPYHEFESTGFEDEYVQNIDMLEDARKEYLEKYKLEYKDPEGKLISPWQDQFFRKATPEEIALINEDMDRKDINFRYSHFDPKTRQITEADVQYVPEGYEKIVTWEKDEKSFKEYIEYWDDKEPLLPGEEPDIEGEHQGGWFRVDEKGEVIEYIRRTNPNSWWDWWVVGGRFSERLRSKSLNAYVNSAQKSDIDWDYMQKENSIEEPNSPALLLFSLVIDGAYYQKGDMGWWGMVSNEKEDWKDEFQRRLDEIPEDYYLTVVDCHI